MNYNNKAIVDAFSCKSAGKLHKDTYLQRSKKERSYR